MWYIFAVARFGYNAIWFNENLRKGFSLSLIFHPPSRRPVTNTPILYHPNHPFCSSAPLPLILAIRHSAFAFCVLYSPSGGLLSTYLALLKTYQKITWFGRWKYVWITQEMDVGELKRSLRGANERTTHPGLVTSIDCTRFLFTSSCTLCYICKWRTISVVDHHCSSLL